MTLFWITWLGCKCNQKYLYKREAGGVLITETIGSVGTEARYYVADFEDGERGAVSQRIQGM